MNAFHLVRILEFPIMIASGFLLIWASLPDANPLAATFRPIWRCFTRKHYFLFMLVAFSVVFIDFLLTTIDEGFTRAILKSRGEDFTSLIWAMEGDLVKYFQTYTWTPLTWYMGWAYIIVFPVLVPWTVIVFDHLEKHELAIRALVGYIMNYLLVLPFYIFFPVRECHVFAPAGKSCFVRLVLNDVHPVVMEVLRPMSGIDNCFPSFHTSLAVTMALFAWRSGRRAFAWVMSAMALSVILSTLYLGVHWLTDVGAGVLVGVLAWWLGERVGGKYWRWWAARRNRN